MSNASTNGTQTLESQIMLIAPTMGFWRGRYVLKDTKVSLGGNAVESDQLTQPCTRLLECCEQLKAWKKRFNDIDNERTTLVDSVSVHAPIRGVRIVPAAAVATLLYGLVGRCDDDGNSLPPNSDNEVPSINYRLQQAADEFVRAFPELQTLMAQNLDRAVWAHVAGKLPSQRELRRYFYLTCPTVTLASASQSSLLLQGADLQNFRGFINTAAARQLDETVTAVVQEPRTELAEAVKALADLIRASGRVTARSFNAVLNALHKMRLFSSLVEDLPLTSAADKLKTKLEETAATSLNAETGISSGVLTILDEVYQVATNQQQQMQVMQYFGTGLRRLLA